MQKNHCVTKRKQRCHLLNELLPLFFLTLHFVPLLPPHMHRYCTNREQKTERYECVLFHTISMCLCWWVGVLLCLRVSQMDSYALMANGFACICTQHTIQHENRFSITTIMSPLERDAYMILKRGSDFLKHMTQTKKKSRGSL